MECSTPWSRVRLFSACKWDGHRKQTREVVAAGVLRRRLRARSLRRWRTQAVVLHGAEGSRAGGACGGDIICGDDVVAEAA